MLAPPLMDHRMTGLTTPEDGAGGAKRKTCTTLHGPSGLPDLKMVPEVQGGMLAPPFMDHRMTSELSLTRTNRQTHAMHRVKHCSSGNGLRQMIQGCVVPQDTAHAGHTLRSISYSAGRWSQRPGAPKRTLSA